MVAVYFDGFNLNNKHIPLLCYSDRLIVYKLFENKNKKYKYINKSAKVKKIIK